jgi:hypothetical protein
LPMTQGKMSVSPNLAAVFLKHNDKELTLTSSFVLTLTLCAYNSIWLLT